MFEYQPIKRKEGIIICGFAGIGKTGFRDYVPNFENKTYYDLPSSAFKEGTERIYIDCAIALAKEHDYVFVSTHNTVIDELLRRGVNFYIVYPRSHCKDEYKQRFIKRGNSVDYINKFMANWDKYISQIDNLDFRNKVQLRTGQYLSDVIERLR